MACMLGFHAQHQCVQRWIQIKPHHIRGLGSKLFVGADAPTAPPLEVNALGAQNPPEGVNAGVKLPPPPVHPQWDMAAGGTSCNVAKTRLRNAASYLTGLPGRDGSRWRHLETVGTETFNSRATC